MPQVQQLPWPELGRNPGTDQVLFPLCSSGVRREIPSQRLKSAGHLILHARPSGSEVALVDAADVPRATNLPAQFLQPTATTGKWTTGHRQVSRGRVTSSAGALHSPPSSAVRRVHHQLPRPVRQGRRADVTRRLVISLVLHVGRDDASSGK